MSAAQAPAQQWVLQGDCLESLRAMPDACIDSVVTDPPYGLSKEPDMLEVVRHWCAAELRNSAINSMHTMGWLRRLDNEQPDTIASIALDMYPDDTYQHGGGGFMGKTWDSFVPGPEVWREVLRVLKPGGHALVFSGTRTYDLTVLAMRIAGFEIRDQLAWMYGSGFPKSRDVSKAIDERLGAVREVIGSKLGRPGYHLSGHDGGEALGHGLASSTPKTRAKSAEITAPATPEAAAWSGWGTALKPAQEPIVLARKPLPKGATVASNVLAHGTGGINVDACRIGTEVRFNPPTHKAGTLAMGSFENCNGEGSTVAGRWPANVLLDETAAAMLDEQTGTLTKAHKAGPQIRATAGDRHSMGAMDEHVPFHYGDTGGASRFFYVAKTSRAEREAGLDHLPVRTGGELTDREDGTDGLNSPRAGAGRKGGRRNHHPTVKPIALMRHLVRLITPPGGIVLDPYCGSGTTLCAAVLEGFRGIGCELTAEYVPIIEGRVAYWSAYAQANEEAAQ